MSESTVTLREYLDALGRRRSSVAAAVLLVLVSVMVYTLLQTPMYSAHAKVLVLPIQHPLIGGVRAAPSIELDLDTEKELFRSDPLVRLVRDALATSQSGAVSARRLSVDVIADTKVFVVRYTDRRPSVAAFVANTFAQVFLDYRRGLWLGPESPGAGQSAPPINADASSRGGAIIARATTPASPSTPKPLRNGAVALLVGLVAGIGLAFVREGLDDRIKSREELAKHLRVGLIGTIADGSNRSKRRRRRRAHVAGRGESGALLSATSPAGETYRSLAVQLRVLAADVHPLRRPLKVLMVTSPVDGEATCAVAANVAAAMCELGKRVVIVCADLRTPRMHQFFGLANEKGLRSLPRSGSDPALVIQETRVENLGVVTAGESTTNPVAVLASAPVQHLFTVLREEADFVVVNAPPVLDLSDTLLLAPMVDAALLVVEDRQSSRASILETRERLESASVRIAGAIEYLNGGKRGRNVRSGLSGIQLEESLVFPDETVGSRQRNGPP